MRIAAGVRRRIRLRVSNRIDSPLSWGLFRPVILIDRRSLSRSEDIDAILAHEVAHVARRDWLLLMLARLALVLFWFNPLVWRLERALVQAAEEAADRQAIERVEPLAYASTLVACVRHAGKSGWALPANGMAPRRALKARVEAILDPKQRGRASSGLVTAAAMGLCLAVAAPVAALEVVSPKPPSPVAKPVAKAAPQRPARPAAEARPAHARRDGDPNPNPNPTRAEEAAVAREMELAHAEVRIPEIHIREIRIPEIHIPAVTISEQHIRIPPIDRDAIRAAAQAGREAGRAGREAGRAGREAGRAAREAYGDRLTPEMIFGITDEKKQAYAEAGYPDLPQKDLVAMAIHGVTPQYIHEMADAGYPGISADMLVQMRIFGISPSAARRAATTQGHPPPEDLIKMKIIGAL